MDNNIGKRIADIRDAQGLTQSDLAKKIKTTQSAIARIESGTQNLTTDMLRKSVPPSAKTSLPSPPAR
jgi:UDP-N-acetylglucosamine 1-carboxyvinyltransferase